MVDDGVATEFLLKKDPKVLEEKRAEIVRILYTAGTMISTNMEGILIESQ